MIEVDFITANCWGDLVAKRIENLLVIQSVSKNPKAELIGIAIDTAADFVWSVEIFRLDSQRAFGHRFFEELGTVADVDLHPIDHHDECSNVSFSNTDVPHFQF